MNLQLGFAQFSQMDAVAAALLVIGWIGIGYLVDKPSINRPSVSNLMAEYRRDWLRNHVTREPRVFDAIFLTNMRHGTTFFASGCMLAIGGVIALVGNVDPLRGVAEDLSLQSGPS